MKTSETIKGIATALVEFHKEVGKIGKDSKNPFFKSDYASLSNILAGVKDPLNKAGLAVVQLPTGEHELTTILMHTSGEYISESFVMKPTKNDPQGIGSCITYQRRYALGAVLSLNIDKDDDAEAATDRTSKVKTPKAKLPNGTSLTDKVDALAKNKFSSPDEFQAWRVDSGLPESLKGANDFDLTKVLMKLGEIQ